MPWAGLENMFLLFWWIPIPAPQTVALKDEIVWKGQWGWLFILRTILRLIHNPTFSFCVWVASSDIPGDLFIAELSSSGRAGYPPNSN
jgi:hypothetical protein